MREELTASVEDYLKTIYMLTAEYDRASTNQIAERMGVKPASVTGMLQKMAAFEPPLVEYLKHKGAVLTEQGSTIALEMIRHHRLLESYLSRELGYSWDEVHGEADRLEHVISEDFEERIAQALGNPSHDPHGEPIPTRDFQVPPQAQTRLSELRMGQEATVSRVDAADPTLLRYLGGLGLKPDVRLRVADYSAFDGNLSLEVAGHSERIVLGPQVTRQIYVELE